jgi:osmotically-inducible protein OsmY
VGSNDDLTPRRQVSIVNPKGVKATEGVNMKTDQQLKDDVEKELRWEPSVDSAAIGVAVKDGAVTLTGHVPSYAQKWAAIRAAERVAGVLAVADELEVKFPWEPREDPEIARAIANALEWNASVPKGRVRAEVRDGWVTLTGEVDWAYQREAAERAVRDIVDIKGVTNSIRVRPTVSPSEVKKQIVSAFERNAELDANRIQVETSNGTVILRGAVSSLTEAQTAKSAAWAAPGVSEVRSYLEVQPMSLAR